MEAGSQERRVAQGHELVEAAVVAEVLGGASAGGRYGSENRCGDRRDPTSACTAARREGNGGGRR